MSNSKEVELEEKELALKEKELEITEKGSKGGPKLKKIFTVLIILSLLALAGFLGVDKLQRSGYFGTDNSKEVELKEKELALKEKELELTEKGSAEDDSDKSEKSENTAKTESVKKVAPPTDSTVATIIASSVVVRAQPNLTAPKVGVLGKGEKVYFLGVSYDSVVWEGENWKMFNVQLENGKRGWVLEKFVERVETEGH